MFADSFMFKHVICMFNKFVYLMLCVTLYVIIVNYVSIFQAYII